MSFTAKREVRHSFDRGAATYLTHAGLQIETADALLNRVAIVAAERGAPFYSALDIGCGPGFMTSRLRGKELAKAITALDISGEMVGQASSFLDGQKISLIQADAEALPFNQESFDLLVSNLMMQWSGRLDYFFSEAARTLRPSGILMATTLGPGSFCELREAMTAAGESVGKPVSPGSFHYFAPAGAIQEAAQRAGLSVEIETIRYHRHYQGTAHLLRSIKGIGANGGRGLGAMGLGRKAIMKAFDHEYRRRYFSPEGIVATYETYFITARK